MLTFQLRRRDLGGPWQATPAGWRAGHSYIVPLRLPALEEVKARCGPCLLVAVRERCRGAAQPATLGLAFPDTTSAGVPLEVSRMTWQAILAEVTSWPLQFVCLTVEPGPSSVNGPQVTVRSGSWGTAPVFAVVAKDTLSGHWDPVRLYPLLSGKAPLDQTLAAYFLATLEAPYARRTMLHGLQLLTERSVARWPIADGTLAIRYPAAAEPFGERDLRPGADVLDGLWRCLTSSVQRWFPAAAPRVGCELSGGLDSALVTAAVAELTTIGPRTYGLALPGRPGISQHVRRAELVRRFGGIDATVPFAGFQPLVPVMPVDDGHGSGRTHDAPFGRGTAGILAPWEECYAEACDAMLEQAVRDGVQMVFTGFGGDELSTPRRRGNRDGTESMRTPAAEEIPAFLTPAAREAALAAPQAIDTMPPGALRASAIEAVAVSASLYLRRGIWPIHPLCTPELVRLCAWLPAQWRADRQFERRLLANRGVSSVVAYASDTDDFEPVLVQSMRHAARARVDSLFATPLLADYGLVDGGQLKAAYGEWCASGDPSGVVPFYAAATLELTLRALAGG